MSLIDELRLDIGDDFGIVWGSESGSAPSVITVYDTALLNDLRLDIGDDGVVSWNGDGDTQVWQSIVITGSTYIITPTDTVIFVNSGVPTSIILPGSPVLGQIVIVKDMSGAAFVNNITITAGTNTIDGFNSVIISQDYQSLTFAWNSIEWNII